MTKYNRFLLLTVAFLIAFPILVKAQSILNPVQQEKAPKVDSIQSAIKAIPLNVINSSYAQSYSLFTRIIAEQITPKERQGLEARVDLIIVEGNKFLADKSELDFEELNFRELERIKNNLDVLLMHISLLQEQTGLIFQRIQKGNEELKENKQRWNLTLRNINISGKPTAIIRRINAVISSNDSISILLENDVNFLLTQSDRVTGVQIRLNRLSADLS